MDVRTGGGDGLRACVKYAERLRSQSWTCTGGVFLATTDSRGRQDDTMKVIAQDVRSTARPRPISGAADDYDSWCENGSICGRKISRYIAEVKGNGAYGDGDGVIGSFDLIYRQSFDGKRPRWRSLLDWDSGPRISPGKWRNNCRINIRDAADKYCGKNPVGFNDIDQERTRAWWPGSRSYEYNEQRLTDGRKYHDDHLGEFVAWGHTKTFKAGVLHTGRWSKCNTKTGCKYYQVPWRP
ncbi:hypothetical protein [Streptomyces jumonjinensis]|uniref:hypothetical protein n=1 Tax=Streptomyces jumonjinensis TaxID=1945 RepID=UPI0037B66CF9